MPPIMDKEADPVTPPETPRRSYWPEAILAYSSLGLTFLGGCFLIGVMLLRSQIRYDSAGSDSAWSMGDLLLGAVLYTMSFVCFVGAAALMLRVVRRLSR